MLDFIKLTWYMLLKMFALCNTRALACRSSCIISDSDLKTLIDNLDGRLNDGTEKWENVIEKSSSLLSYSAKCCKPKVIFLFRTGGQIILYCMS